MTSNVTLLRERVLHVLLDILRWSVIIISAFIAVAFLGVYAVGILPRAAGFVYACVAACTGIMVVMILDHIDARMKPSMQYILGNLLFFTGLIWTGMARLLALPGLQYWDFATLVMMGAGILWSEQHWMALKAYRQSVREERKRVWRDAKIVRSESER